MAGMLDKLKETFGKAKTKASDVANSESVESFKGKASEVAGKVGEKVPDKVKDTYGKVADKVSDIIPGGDDEPADDTAAAATVDETTTTTDPAPATDQPATDQPVTDEPEATT